ncbi:bZIP transcription factor [Aspergillus alliaceus]|uniref:bZIP transcription factor n=1 Tax=Petromyces alliaceus TaxID=209559 RepID=UPI0012A5C8EE|nr:uncharacterized protein BDW43DRAFT_313464 [Aspergillus alliaceus]KAB8230892.1 hypothetical protein BDW43DRAFT_313464 [Aspergillus alliaceus]
MAPKNAADSTPMHFLSHQDSSLLATRRLPLPTPSYPASSSPTRLVGPGVPASWECIASQSPLTEVSRPGPSPERTYIAPTASKPFSGSVPCVPVGFQPTPNSRPNPHSQDIIPPTCISTYSRFKRSSPAISDPGNPHPPFKIMDLAHASPGIVSGRISREETPWTGVTAPPENPLPENPPLLGMIPCILDLKSGLSSKAKKRKASKDSSRRYRNRKRNEMQIEQKITAQQCEIRMQLDALQRQAQEIQALQQERDFYRAECDSYREHIARLDPANQLPARPASSQQSNKAFCSSLENGRNPAGELAPVSLYQPAEILAGQPVPPTRSLGPWRSAPS